MAAVAKTGIKPRNPGQPPSPRTTAPIAKIESSATQLMSARLHGGSRRTRGAKRHAKAPTANSHARENGLKKPHGTIVLENQTDNANDMPAISATIARKLR